MSDFVPFPSSEMQICALLERNNNLSMLHFSSRTNFLACTLRTKLGPGRKKPLTNMCLPPMNEEEIFRTIFNTADCGGSDSHYLHHQKFVKHLHECLTKYPDRTIGDILFYSQCTYHFRILAL